MKPFRYLATLALAGTLTAGAANPAAPHGKNSASPPAPGQPAPDLALLDQSGTTVRLSTARGKKVVLVFYRGYW
jgi:cytochrome oxidase Cu insertion factor (SCO1/SenC/PrrC family)